MTEVRRLSAATLLLTLTVLPGRAVEAASAPLACETAAIGDLTVGAAGAHSLVAVPDIDGDALLRLEESGHDLDYSTDDGATWRPVGVRPPRLGLEYVAVDAGDAVQLRSTRPTDDTARARYALMCAPDAATIATAACIESARTAEATGDVTPGTLPGTPPLCTALIQHAGATWSSRNHRPRESIARYDAAIAAWAAAGDAAREAAAWLGLTEQHWRAADYAAAIDAATRAETLARVSDQPYFATRARMERCLALDALGEAAAVDVCLEGLPERYAELGELNDAANARTSQASIALERGDVLAAERYIAAALAIAPARLSGLTTGRLHLVEAQVAVQRGRFDAALVAIDASLTAFESVRDRRGMANAQLIAAAIMLALDAPADATELATQAHATYVAIDAPARAAAALTLLARVAQAGGDAGTAITQSMQAAALYRAQDVPWRALDASLVAVALGDRDAAATLQAALGEPELPTALRARAQLALADAALARGDVARARSRLTALGSIVLDPLQAHHRTLIETALDIREGKPARAIADLDAAIERVHRLAGVLPSASLRFALGAQLAELRWAWVDAWVALPADERPDAAAVWRMQVRTGREALLAPRDASIKLPADALARFEAITALAMVPTDADTPAADGGQRALLAYQAALGAAPGASGGDWLTLSAVQAALADGDRVLALATGTGGALRIDITRDHAHVAMLPYGSAPRDALAALGALVLQPTSAPAAIDAAARKVSDWLFADLADARPTHLFVHADALRATGALGLLRWPGDDAVLAESTRASWLASGRRGRAQAAATGSVDVFVASAVVDSGVARALGELANAEVEVDWIGAALDRTTVDARTGADFTRDALAQALSRDGARVHIATHGRTRRGLLGQSGLLLPRAGSGELAFVSWIGLADQPIRADLLLLNACDLADGPGSGATRQTAFANALAASGARDTVAALWPVSDGAAAVWVPAFYRALAETPDDPARALQQAQSALRASRMYRHPHYWSALIHLTSIAPAALSAAPARP